MGKFHIYLIHPVIFASRKALSNLASPGDRGSGKALEDTEIKAQTLLELIFPLFFKTVAFRSEMHSHRSITLHFAKRTLLTTPLPEPASPFTIFMCTQQPEPAEAKGDSQRP